MFSKGRLRGPWRASSSCAVALFFGCFCGAGPLLAAPSDPSNPSAKTVEGRVVAFELGDLVVDIASDRGASAGALLELWRPLILKHPVTGQTISERFLIGRLRLSQVRGALSLALPEGKLAQAAQPGDIVILHRAGVQKAAAKPSTSEPVPAPAEAAPAPALTPFGAAVEPKSELGEPAASEPDADTAEVSAIFGRLSGASVRRRIVAYEAYVARHPRGKYAPVLYEEAAHLRRLVGLETGSDARHQSALRNFTPPLEARTHTPLQIAIELTNAPVAALLHTRDAGAVVYGTTPMQRVGEGYFSAVISAERVHGPRLEYFVEGVASDGQPMTVLGTALEPQSVPVEDVPEARPPLRPPATITVSTDYADWNNLKGNDVVWQTEGSVGMRFQDVGVRAARMGFGVYRGIGGSLVELDQEKLSGRRVGLTYGYLEGEFGLSHFTSIIGRLVIGLEDDGVNGGAQALLRIGNDRETNLTIGGEALGGIGVRGITELQLATFARVPILFRTEVTNQPAGTSSQVSTVTPAGVVGVANAAGQVGVRAIVQVGYRFLPDLVVAVRGSYQGRTINHAGPGFGGAVTYQW